jgi:DNA invertase Pin-like site-specific DNA recombinase
MPAFLDPPLAPRSGLKLQVLATCRISGDNQDRKSLDDQEALYWRWLQEHTELSCDMEVLAGRGSGECLDRAEYLRAIELVESKQFDLVLTEDLGRICRRVHAHIFCETCEDTDTRLIALNDHVDTGREDWRLSSFFAVMRHETYNKDTANRIRRTLRNRFSQGGVFQCEIYGYRKPPGAKGEADVEKDPSAEAIYQEWFRRLESGGTYAEIADWLNDQHIPTGPHCRSRRWTVAMVSRVTHNAILKGTRVRNDKISRRINKTGRRRSVKAPPQERLERHCEHLAFFEPDYYDRVVRMVDQRNAKYRRRGMNGIDQRKDVPKKRTAWPGQHLRCGVCGRLYYWTGLAGAGHMMCSGSHEYLCWNSIVVNGTLAARKLSQAILGAIQDLPEYDDALLARVHEKVQAARGVRAARSEERARRRRELDTQIARITAAIANTPSSRALQEALLGLEAERDRLEEEADADARQERSVKDISLPPIDDIKRMAAEVFPQLAVQEPEAGRMIRRLIPELRVYPYRLCDGGAVVQRAHLTLNLAALVPAGAALEGIGGALRRQLVVDLFAPPQRAACREQVVALRAEGVSERTVARRLRITVTAAQRAAALARRMQELGITDPYLPILEPPADCGKLRRHRHSRYRFEPQNGDPPGAG